MGVSTHKVCAYFVSAVSSFDVLFFLGRGVGVLRDMWWWGIGARAGLNARQTGATLGTKRERCAASAAGYHSSFPPPHSVHLPSISPVHALKRIFLPTTVSCYRGRGARTCVCALRRPSELLFEPRHRTLPGAPHNPFCVFFAPSNAAARLSPDP